MFNYLVENHYLLMLLITWLISGLPGNILAFIILWKRKQQLAKINSKLIINGKKLIGIFSDEWFEGKVLNVSVSLPWFTLFFVGNFMAFLGSCLWPVGLSIYLFILIVSLVSLVCDFIEKSFFLEKHKVIRFLKKHPELVDQILNNNDHLYYKIAQQLKESKTLTIDKATGIVNIDGKDYKVKFK